MIDFHGTEIAAYSGHLVISTEPSHLDWTALTRSRFDHHGIVVPWTTTKAFEDAGFVDSYRERYPNPLINPGITWPSDNSALGSRESVRSLSLSKGSPDSPSSVVDPTHHLRRLVMPTSPGGPSDPESSYP